MSEVPRFYSDSFEIVGNPYGVTFKFKRRPAVIGTTPPPPEDVAEVSMSWEHLKALTYILWRYIRALEDENGISYPISTKVLSELKIGKEDWEKFWQPPPLL